MIEKIADAIWFLIEIFIITYILCYIIIKLKKEKKNKDITNVYENMIERYKNK